MARKEIKMVEIIAKIVFYLYTFYEKVDKRIDELMKEAKCQQLKQDSSKN